MAEGSNGTKLTVGDGFRFGCGFSIALFIFQLVVMLIVILLAFFMGAALTLPGLKQGLLLLLGVG